MAHISRDEFAKIAAQRSNPNVGDALEEAGIVWYRGHPANGDDDCGCLMMETGTELRFKFEDAKQYLQSDDDDFTYVGIRRGAPVALSLTVPSVADDQSCECDDDGIISYLDELPPEAQKPIEDIPGLGFEDIHRCHYVPTSDKKCFEFQINGRWRRICIHWPKLKLVCW